MISSHASGRISMITNSGRLKMRGSRTADCLPYIPPGENPLPVRPVSG
ncbi:hypothetical protein HMPREF1546_03321 [Oscillibacter sp. KLE 1745]|nr:hypothetical protein HMPREF1546_03321 [Oscillibacter sp. KLE 1745]